MRHQKQLPASNVEVVARAYAVDGGVVQVLACTLLLATTLVAATLSPL